EDLPDRMHSRRRDRQGSGARGPAGLAGAGDGAGRAALRVPQLRLGWRLVPPARRDDAGRWAGCVARHGRHLVRLGRRPRYPRSRDALGAAPEDLPGLRPVRQRAAHAHPAGHRRTAEALRAEGPGLGDRARELRGRVRGRRRARPPGPPDRGRHGRQHDDAHRRRAHHAVRLPARAVAPAPATHGGDQVQRAAARDGDVGRDRAAGQPRVPRRALGQGTGGRLHRAHGQPARLARHPGGDQPPRRHPQRPGRGAGRQPGHRAHRQHRSRAALPEHVRAHPRLGLRHHGPGSGQPGRHVLVLRDAAGASGRDRGRRAPDAHGGERDGRPAAAHARPRRQRDDGPGDRCGVPPIAERL
ncbi:MAG: D-malate dehydrogenase [decarboxylating], partial [uncultured Ramlibacter sp.]